MEKVRRGLSAGRVQSVAVRLVVDRENEIRAFVPQEYWSIDAKFTAPSRGKCCLKPQRWNPSGGQNGDSRQSHRRCFAGTAAKCQLFCAERVKKRVSKRHPAPPFITSTLQQDASYRLGFQSKRTMKVAQELYEGVDIDGLGAVGLITYMRTDSLRISAEAQHEAAADYVTGKYGAEYLPPERRNYKSKKNAQDAHEAIRPSMPDMTPERVKSSLTADQYKLYRLIWERFIASQMADALLDTVSVDIEADNCMFKATGSTVKFDGFTVLYDDVKGDKSENKNLPELENGMEIKVKSLEGNQHFTQAPPRYTEATLIKALEENGIGRPSTYAPTITTITTHLYVEREGKQLKPTVLGEVTTELMKEHFPNILDVKFTADMENSLDDVERGKKSWVDTLEDFYGDFSKTLETAEEKMEGKRVKVPDEETDIVCDQCGRNMVIKIGRYGRFLACPGFPECKNTKKIVHTGNCRLLPAVRQSDHSEKIQAWQKLLRLQCLSGLQLHDMECAYRGKMSPVRLYAVPEGRQVRHTGLRKAGMRLFPSCGRRCLNGRSDCDRRWTGRL